MYRKIKYKSAVPLGKTNKAKIKDLAQAIRKVIQLYSRADIGCSEVRTSLRV